MRLAHISVVAVLLMAVGLVGSISAADARSKRTCSLKKSKTYKKNKEARVFARRETSRDGLLVKSWYGCHRKTKKRIRIGETEGYDTPAILVKLQGRFVAVWQGSEDRGGMRYADIVQWDLKAAKRLRTLKNTDAEDIEIGPAGQLVFIGRPLAQKDEQEQPLSVRVVDGKGDRTLATGNIAPKSLVIKGTTISWTQDRAPRTAQL
jgi:hypothetical protein